MKIKAFTLAETLITLTILGVIAAITVPSLINKQIESANRTKLKKAMAVYEKALNQMIIDNDLKTNDAIKAEFPTNDCSKTSIYFKPVEKVSGNDCRFKTADRVWWDISNIENPIISLKDEIKTNDNAATVKSNAESTESDKTSFAMIGYLDSNGILRINDLGAAVDKTDGVPTAKNKTYLSKLYGFMNNEKIEDNSNKIKYCSETIDDWNTPSVSCLRKTSDVGGLGYIYNSNGEVVAWTDYCDENYENCSRCHTYSNNGGSSNCEDYGYTNCTIPIFGQLGVDIYCCKEGETYSTSTGHCE